MENAIHEKQLRQVVPYTSLEELPPSVQDQLAHLRHDVPNVALLYYGGTLGAHQDPEGYLVPTNDAAQLLQPLTIKGLDREVNVVWVQVYPTAIDSTNGRWVHWVTIGNAVRLLHDLVDGFVVAGGTDTMAHLMAALNFMFPNIGKPVIGVGAQLPMFRQGDDATRNLYFAVSAALSDLSGAHLAFADVLRHGLHLFKVADRRFDAFDCPQRYVIGHYDGQVNVYDNAPRRNPLVTQSRLDYLPDFREGIKVVKISPATVSEAILHDAKDPTCVALLLITFGAGNVRDTPLYEGERTHVEIIADLSTQGLPVILGSPMMDGVVDSPYRAGAKAIEAGGISGGDTCGAALEVKAMRCAALAWDRDQNHLNHDQFRAQMYRNHVGELTSIRK